MTMSSSFCKTILNLFSSNDDNEGERNETHPPGDNEWNLYNRIFSENFNNKSSSYDFDHGKNVKVLYERFGDDPKTVLRLHCDDTIPRPKNAMDVVIMVEASTVSQADCIIRRGQWKSNPEVPLPSTPGFDCIGRILYSGRQARKKFKMVPGNRVASLLQWGGNARYATVCASELIRVPDPIAGKEDGGAIVSLISSYMIAFSCLYFGERRKTRHRDNALSNKQILVTGAVGNVIPAIVELARIGGASKIFVTALGMDHDFLKNLGAEPLSVHRRKWLPVVEGQMDIVIDGGGEKNELSFPEDALGVNGKYVCIGMSHPQRQRSIWCNTSSKRKLSIYLSRKASALFSSKSMSITSRIGSNNSNKRRSSCVIIEKSKNEFVSWNDKNFFYGLLECWAMDHMNFQKDFLFLLKLLSLKKISPTISGRIPLGEVVCIHHLLQKEKIRGVFVCEPWMKNDDREIE